MKKYKNIYGILEKAINKLSSFKTNIERYSAPVSGVNRKGTATFINRRYSGGYIPRGVKKKKGYVIKIASTRVVRSSGKRFKTKGVNLKSFGKRVVVKPYRGKK